ncbi:MAG TPA: bifunctional diaminohydroxyphosphoribosylaminopyrimidine deaminase/5-amino-6-(5-phosphoribosylamino)uracil reductase RibD [Candidatus Binatia bacterium]|jgi:diaminohydroxyphosphoribosylaminopyrimidine deaminase/5-amino-6-(5-phosphoribosylamino)uracil reductase|nr:bifunctional diaminohydroxyphosphoribosylaminopyrimidine deaminase/5-amino-6-(5-phosphoribosylamino)uracil reductase RibD [Candidatus Binatia bacterium]
MPSSDAAWMARALALAARGLGRTFPNPAVGAIFVRAGRVVGEGFHARAGAAHAEVEALRRAGARARGATLYVTLEPCAHQGRTPPCVDALLPLGLARVVVATGDPDPRVRGRGIRALRRAGIPVDVGVGRADADLLLAGYRSRILRGRPQVTLKLALTLDGRIAAQSGDARWITGPAARRMGHALRDVSDAILVGAGTVRADDPRLTCRLPGGHDPIRVVVAGAGLDLPTRAQLLAPGGPPTWIVAPRTAPAARVERLRRRGIEMILLPARRGRIAFDAIARSLGDRGITSLLVEGGGTVAAAALRDRCVDRAVLFLAPMLLGGDALPAVGALGIARIADAIRLDGLSVARVGDDLVLEGRVRYRSES